MKPLTLYTSSRGLNTRIDPQRLLHGTKDDPGVVEFAQAVNISIDDRGMVSLRNGDTLVHAGEFHSLFCSGGDCFVVQERTTDAAIMQVGHDLSITGIRSNLTKNRRMSWAQAGGVTYYSNGEQNGRVEAGVSSAWPVDAYNGPESALEFMAAPLGKHIAIKRGGLMFIAAGRTLWVNHSVFLYGLFNRVRGFVQFSTDIIMVCPVSSGVFVSDTERIWFLRGTSWNEFKQEAIAPYPAIEWSLAHDPVPLKRIGVEESGVEGRVWASKEGICIGMDDGTMRNITEPDIKYPSDVTFGACLVDGTVIHNTASNL